MKNGSSAYLYNNQAHGDDTYLIRELGPESVLDAVLDGVSTGKGSVASQLTIKALKEASIKSSNDIIGVLRSVNEALYRETNGFSLATAALAFKQGGQLTLINVGDSPAYLIRDGKIEELTVMDKVSGDLVTITNAVGIGPTFDYHTKQIQLKSDDKLILVSDGISDNVTPEELLNIVKVKAPKQAIDQLTNLLSEKQAANQGRKDRFGHFKPDDMTGIVRYF